MSSDSTSDEHGEFDFGAWCPVCERQITTSTPEVNEPAPTHQASLKKSKGKAGQQVKRRPSTKKKTNSSSSLRALTAVTEPEQLEPPSELYCSDECRRIDEMRSRLALSNIGEPAYRPPMMARSLSGTSSKDGWDALNFTTRRPSRGVVGGYSYRPSLMARVPSNQDPHRPISNASSDSLASLGMADADERSERGYGGTRPPSALSSFRFMTPIQSPLASPQVPTSTSQAATHPPAARGRQRTLMPRAQSENTVVQQHPRRSQSSTGKKALPMASPPLASPEPGPSSVPSSSLLVRRTSSFIWQDHSGLTTHESSSRCFHRRYSFKPRTRTNSTAGTGPRLRSPCSARLCRDRTARRTAGQHPSVLVAPFRCPG